MVNWHPEPEIDEKTLVDLKIVYAEKIVWTLNEYTSAQTLSVNNYLVMVNAPGNTKITLPAAAYHADRIYTIKNIHSSGTVTIDGNSTEKIDGEETIDLNLQYSYVTIVCDGDEWLIIGGQNVKIDELLRAILSALNDINETAKKSQKELEEINT